MAATDLRSLGRRLAAVEDAAIADRERPPIDDRLVAVRAAVRRRREAGATSLRRPIAIGAAIGAVAAAAILWPRAEPLRFAVGQQPMPGTLGGWVAAPRAGETPIDFSDGSRVMLGAGARARIVGVGGRGAKVVVERGTVRADVVPREGNDWSVLGGPFEIHVTGTSFDASWDPEREELRVTMYEGKVIVRGACLAHDRALSRGESATLSCANGVVMTNGPANGAVTMLPRASTNPGAVEPGPLAVPAPVAADAKPQGAPDPASHRSDVATRSVGPLGAASTRAIAPASSAPASSAPAAPSQPAPSWRDLAARGDFKRALAAAEADDFAALCASLSEHELVELATTARLGGRSLRAREAYTAIRRRFAGSDAAATAAFHLGQSAFDGAHAFSEAHRWFAVYLAERPGGALAAEALGRTMEAEQRMGDLDAARATASRYLARFPSGAHAALAQSLLAP